MRESHYICVTQSMENSGLLYYYVAAGVGTGYLSDTMFQVHIVKDLMVIKEEINITRVTNTEMKREYAQTNQIQKLTLYSKPFMKMG